MKRRTNTLWFMRYYDEPQTGKTVYRNHICSMHIVSTKPFMNLLGNDCANCGCAEGWNVDGQQDQKYTCRYPVGENEEVRRKPE